MRQYLLVGKNKTRMELVVDLLEVVLVEVELERNYKHLMEEIDLAVVDQSEVDLLLVGEHSFEADSLEVDQLVVDLMVADSFVVELEVDLMVVGSFEVAWEVVR